MTLFLKNTAKIFASDERSLDAKLWLQKVILKKYLKKFPIKQNNKEIFFK